MATCSTAMNLPSAPTRHAMPWGAHNPASRQLLHTSSCQLQVFLVRKTCAGPNRYAQAIYLLSWFLHNMHGRQLVHRRLAGQQLPLPIAIRQMQTAVYSGGGILHLGWLPAATGTASPSHVQPGVGRSHPCTMHQAQRLQARWPCHLTSTVTTHDSMSAPFPCIAQHAFTLSVVALPKLPWSSVPHGVAVTVRLTVAAAASTPPPQPVTWLAQPG